MDPIVKPFILRSHRKTLLAKPFLLVTQPLSLCLIHPQNLGKEAGQMHVEKEGDVDSFYTRGKKKKDEYSPYMMVRCLKRKEKK